MYDAWHEIVPVTKHTGPRVSSDVVGPVCESGDYFCKGPPISPGSRKASIWRCSAPALYGFAMASNYNARPLAAEVLVHGSRSAVVRPRQRLEEMAVGVGKNTNSLAALRLFFVCVLFGCWHQLQHWHGHQQQRAAK